jgi:hypothetical protein
MRGSLQAALCLLACACGPVLRAQGFVVVEDSEQVRISGLLYDAAIVKSGYVSGVAAGSFRDRKTGFRDRAWPPLFSSNPAPPNADVPLRAYPFPTSMAHPQTHRRRPANHTG